MRRTYTRFAIFVPVPYKRVKNDVLDYISWTLTVNVRLWIISVPQFFLDSELNSFDFSLLLVSFNVGSYQGKEATTISTSSSSLPDLLHHIPSLQMKCMQPPRHTARPKRFRNPPNIEIHHSLFLLLANTKQPRFLWFFAGLIFCWPWCSSHKMHERISGILDVGRNYKLLRRIELTAALLCFDGS